MQNQRRIAIAGAGLGGLALAVTIGKYDSETPIDLYEAGAEVTTAGAGITMWKRTWQVMQRLGLDVDLSKRTTVPPLDQEAIGLLWRKADIPTGGYTLLDQVVPYGSIGIHRADLLDVLMMHLPKSCTVHTRKRLTHYTTNEPSSGSPLTLYFADGTSETADVLIGADGIRSATRQTMFETIARDSGTTPSTEHLSPIWSGAFAYRCLIPREDIEKVSPDHRILSRGAIYCGKSKHVVAYPVSQGRFINVVAFYTHPNSEGSPYEGKWVANTSKEELLSCFTNYEPEAQIILKHMETPSRWAVHVMRPLPRWVSGNVAILGDASHAMRPAFGTGAGSAIEDAYILGRLLCLKVPLSVSELLKIYEKVRLHVGNELLIKARETSFLNEFDLPGYADGSSQGPEEGKEEMKRHVEGMQKRWEKAHFSTVPDDEWEEAMQLVGQATGGDNPS